MTEIKVGDVVTWQTAPNSLGIANCTVISFGTAFNGEPAATIEALGQRANAYIDQLHKDGCNCKICAPLF
jgi:hypothetical protein